MARRVNQTLTKKRRAMARSRRARTAITTEWGHMPMVQRVLSDKPFDQKTSNACVIVSLFNLLYYTDDPRTPSRDTWMHTYKSAREIWGSAGLYVSEILAWLTPCFESVSFEDAIIDLRQGRPIMIVVHGHALVMIAVKDSHVLLLNSYGRCYGRGGFRISTLHSLKRQHQECVRIVLPTQHL